LRIVFVALLPFDGLGAVLLRWAEFWAVLEAGRPCKMGSPGPGATKGYAGLLALGAGRRC